MRSEETVFFRISGKGNRNIQEHQFTSAAPKPLTNVEAVNPQQEEVLNHIIPLYHFNDPVIDKVMMVEALELKDDIPQTYKESS